MPGDKLPLWHIALGWMSLLLCLLAAPAAAQACDTPRNRQALNDLYQATNGPSWTLPGSLWNTSALITTWQGITCSGNNVSTIMLQDKGLSGTLPASLAVLTDLETLALTIRCNHRRNAS